jgi:hypothetical protein
LLRTLCQHLFPTHHARLFRSLLQPLTSSPDHITTHTHSLPLLLLPTHFRRHPSQTFIGYHLFNCYAVSARDMWNRHSFNPRWAAIFLLSHPFSWPLRKQLTDD